MKKKTFSPPSQNPFVKNKELIKQQGVVVFDYVTSLASYTERVISPNIVIAIFHSGVIRLEYDMQPIVFRSKGICVLYPNHIVSVKDVSPDLQATLIVISNQFYDEMLRHSLRRYKNEYLKAPFFKLTNQQYETTLHIVEVVKAACQIKGASRTNIIVDILDILARMTDYHRFHDKAPKEDISSNELLFYHLILCRKVLPFTQVLRQRYQTDNRHSCFGLDSPIHHNKSQAPTQARRHQHAGN